jgi:4-hydroxybenzoate polyprenyltransferase
MRCLRIEKIKAYLQLLRIPNIVTSSADVLAGGMIAVALAGSNMDKAVFLLLVLSSCFLYAGGVALNDVVDASVDSEERPERPIPSGTISKETATRLAWMLLILGLMSASLAGPISFIVAVVLVGAIVLYNYYAKKKHIFGSFTMGCCRSLNLCLGFSLFSEQLMSNVWLALFPLVHIMGVTSLSHGEIKGLARRRVLLLYMIPWVLAIFLVALALTVSGAFPPFIAFGFISLYVLGNAFAYIPAIRRPESALILRGVKYGILSLILLNAAMVSVFAGWFQASMIVSLIGISWFLARRVSMT